MRLMAFGPMQRTDRSDIRWALLAAIAGLAILSASCNARQPTSTAESNTVGPTVDAPDGTTPAAEPEPDDERHKIPEELQFSAPLLAGGMVRGAEYAGRDVAVWFWAPW